MIFFEPAPPNIHRRFLTENELHLLLPFLIHGVKVKYPQITDSTLAKLAVSEFEGQACLCFSDLVLTEKYISRYPYLTEPDLIGLTFAEVETYIQDNYSSFLDLPNAVCSFCYQELSNKVIVTDSCGGRPSIRHRPLDFQLRHPTGSFDDPDGKIKVKYTTIDKFDFTWAIETLKKKYPMVKNPVNLTDQLPKESSISISL